MNVADVLFYGNRTLMNALEGLEEEDWQRPGVCGRWSVHSIMAHLASYEQWHLEILRSFQIEGPTPYMEEHEQLGGRFNDAQVERRSAWPVAKVLEEYEQAHAAVLEQVPHIPRSVFQENGTLPWYGAEYCLEDFLVYSSYGHKREHSAQIHVFRDAIRQSAR